MIVRLFTLSVLISLFSVSAYGQEGQKTPVPQMKTQILIKEKEKKTSELNAVHPATHRLSTAKEELKGDHPKAKPSPDDLILSYQRKLDSLSETYRSENPEMVEKLERLIAEQKAIKKN